MTSVLPVLVAVIVMSSETSQSVVPIAHDVSVKCENDGMSASFPVTFLSTLVKLVPHEIVLVEGNSPRSESCRSISNGTHLIASSDFQHCVFAKKSDSKNVMYLFRAELWTKPVTRGGVKASLVSRDKRQVFQFNCTYPLQYTVTSDDVDPASEEVNVEVTASGEYDVRMEVYETGDYAKVVDTKSAVYLIPERVFIQISTPVDNLVLRIDDCMTSSTADFAESEYMLQGGCPIDADQVATGPAVGLGKARFDFEAALLSDVEAAVGGSSSVNYVRCDVTTCDVNTQSTCFDLPQCSKRKKRNAKLSDGEKTELMLGITTLSCQEDNKCEESCMVIDGKDKCTCPHGKKLGEDGTSCHERTRKPLKPIVKLPPSNPKAPPISRDYQKDDPADHKSRLGWSGMMEMARQAHDVIAPRHRNVITLTTKLIAVGFFVLACIAMVTVCKKPVKCNKPPPQQHVIDGDQSATTSLTTLDDDVEIEEQTTGLLANN